MSLNLFSVTDYRPGVELMHLHAHVQTLLSCLNLKQAALGRLRVRLNVILF